MIQDAATYFAVSQNLTGAAVGTIAAGTFTPLENFMSLTQARDLGEGEQLFAYVKIDTTVTGSTFLNFTVVTSNDGIALTPLGSTGPIAVAGLTANSVYYIAVGKVAGIVTPSTLFGMVVEPIGGTVTAGAVSAGLTLNTATHVRPYASRSGLTSTT